MKLIYVLTIKKHYAQKGNHPTLIAIRAYINYLGKEDLLICWPGYLSTNAKTAKTFHNRFPIKLSKGISTQNNPCFFFNGNNGKRIIGSATSTIAKYTNSLYNSYFSSYCPNEDHSKIIAFCDTSTIGAPANGSTIDSFISNIIGGKVKVKAILIGSSNQSHSTMTKISPDKKGECDVLLLEVDDEVNENAVCSQMFEQLFERENGDKNHDSFLFSKEIASTFTLNEMFGKFLCK